MTDNTAQDQTSQQPAQQQVQRPVLPPATDRPKQMGRTIQAPSSVSGNRELAPLSVATDEDEPAAAASAAPQPQIEVSKPKEISVPKELQEVGVEVGKDAKEIQLDEELKNAGVTMAKESVPVAQQPTVSIKLPMSEAEALDKMKRSKIKDAIKWIAGLVAFQWKRHLARLNPQEYK